MRVIQRRSDRGGEEMTVTTVRIPRSIMERVDRLMDQDEIPLSKNVWFLLAVKEKLERDEAAAKIKHKEAASK
jgi:hypothetical protein